GLRHHFPGSHGPRRARRRPRAPAGLRGSPMALAKTADIVVIGAGAVGTSIAYHLARRGQRNVVVLDQDAVGSGTTSKAAGGIRAQFPTDTEIRISLECIKVFEHFEEEFGVDPGYRKIGYLSLITDEADLKGYEPRI